MNENYVQPPMPKGKDIKDGILKGMYKLKASPKKAAKVKAHLLGSGTILNETLKAQEILEKDYDVSTDVWSVTSYKNLHLDALETERWNMLNPDKKAKTPYISEITKDEKGIFVSASDYVQILGDSISKWLPGPLHTLGTFGFGRSEDRSNLRNFFEVDAKHIVYATLYSLVKEGSLKKDILKKAIKDLVIDTDKPNPMFY